MIRQIDIFGSSFQFTIYKNNKFKTRAGGIFTIVCILLIIMFSFVLGNDFYFQKNPKTLETTTVPDLSLATTFRMTPKNFVFAWRFSDANNVPKFDYANVLYPSFSHIRYKKDSTGAMQNTRNIPIPFSKCNLQNAQMPEFNTKYKLDDWYCMDWATDNFTLGGYWDNSFVDYMSMSVALCPDGWSFGFVNCTSLNSTATYMNDNFYIEVLLPQFIFQPNDVQNPLQLYFKDYFFKVSRNLQKSDRIFVKNVTILDDQGWIATNNKESNLYTYNTMETDLRFLSDADFTKVGVDSTLYSLTMYFQNPFTHYTRSYMKIQDLMAVIGGFIKIILMGGAIISSVFNKFYWQEILSNELFEYNADVDKKKIFLNAEKIKNLDLVSIDKSENLGKSNDISVIIPNKENNANLINHNPYSRRRGFYPVNIQLQKTNTINPLTLTPVPVAEKSSRTVYNLKRNENSAAIHHHAVNFGLGFYFLRMYLGKCKKVDEEKGKLFDFLQNFFADRLDVVFYLKTLEKLDRLKLILFNRHQNLSFEFLKKPNLCANTELLSLDMDIHQDTKKHMNEIVDYYRYKIENHEMDHIDEHIYSMVSPDIKKLC